MSNQGYYQGHQGRDNHNQLPYPSQQSQQAQYQSQAQQAPMQQQQHHGFAAPPGPPPARSNTFNEQQFVAPEERSEQREAMENFEMHRTKPESQTERDVATLQEEFPRVDGSLIAALYGDSQSLSATREMLNELATST